MFRRYKGGLSWTSRSGNDWRSSGTPRRGRRRRRPGRSWSTWTNATTWSSRVTERTSSILASSSSPCSRCDQTVTSKSATLTGRSTRGNVASRSSSTRLYQCCKDITMSGLWQHKAKTSNTQSVTASALHVQSRSRSRCVRDHWFSWHAFLNLNAVRMETTYEQAWIVRESESLGSPSSKACLWAFAHGWTRWAGRSKLVCCDRGTHNGGVSGSTHTKNGVAIRPAGLEVPEQIGRVERRNDMSKKMMSKVIKDTMDMIVSECESL